jgi:hypothetical protein
MTPPLRIAPEPEPHPRGIVELDQSCPGKRTFRVYDCRGVELEERTVPFTLTDGHTQASLRWTLEHHCPSNPARHEVICPGDGPTFRLRVLR